MSRIQNILSEARIILADTTKKRYTDDDLILYLNKGLIRVNEIAKVLKAKSFVKIEKNIALYNLSNLVLEFERIQYLEKNLEIKTEIELDKLDEYWQNKVGPEVEFIAMDKLKQGFFKIYPKIEENTLDSIVQNQIFGIIIDIDVTDDLFELPSDNIPTDNLYKYLTVYYVKKPNLVDIDTADEEFEFDESVDTALVYFVAGRALRSDGDTQNRQFGTENLGLFDTYLAEITDRQTRDNNTLNYREIEYRGFL